MKHRRITAIILAIAMIATMLPFMAMPASAAATTVTVGAAATANGLTATLTGPSNPVDWTEVADVKVAFTGEATAAGTLAVALTASAGTIAIADGSASTVNVAAGGTPLEMTFRYTAPDSGATANITIALTFTACVHEYKDNGAVKTAPDCGDVCDKCAAKFICGKPVDCQDCATGIHNIDYTTIISGLQVNSTVATGGRTVTGTGDTATVTILTPDPTDFQLCIETERIYYRGPGSTATPPAFPTGADARPMPGLISYDGGNRWATVSIPVTGGLDISRQITRGATIWLASGSGRAPVIDADEAKATATIWTFPVINARPGSERIKLDFFTLLDPALGGNTLDRWTIDGMDAAKIQTLQIALADGRVAAKSGWGTIRTGTDIVANNPGIYVQTVGDARGRIAPSQYLIRVAPVADPLTPGSNPARVRAAGAGRAPSLRVDFRNEIIRGRAGTVWHTTANAENTGIANTWRPGAEITRENAREVGMIRILYGARYAFRTVPTAERAGRPASLWQTINVPNQTPLTVAGVLDAAKANNGRLQLARGTNIWDEGRGRWGGAPRAPAAAGDVTVRVRQAATMRHNTRNAGTPDEFIGETATNEVSVILTYGNTGTEARPRIGLTGVSVNVTADTPLTANEIIFANPVVNQTIEYEAGTTGNSIKDKSVIAAFTIFTGAAFTGHADLTQAASYVLSGLPAPFITSGDDANVGLVFEGTTARIEATKDIAVTGAINVAARVALAGTAASPAIPNAAFWSATATRTITPTPQTLDQAEAAVKAALVAFEATNRTSANDVLTAVSRAITNSAIRATWSTETDKGFALDPATISAAGEITGDIILTEAGTPPVTRTVEVDMEIEQLS